MHSLIVLAAVACVITIPGIAAALAAFSPGEVAISLAILLVSTVIVSRAAAKIFRVGILMYGKRPSFAELLRWLKY